MASTFGRSLPVIADLVIAVILIVILIIIGIPSPTHSFTLGLNPSFSANPPYPSLSFFSFRFYYMDFPDCLLLLLAAVSVLIGPCCPALLNRIHANVYTVVLLGKINDDDNDDPSFYFLVFLFLHFFSCRFRAVD